MANLTRFDPFNPLKRFEPFGGLDESKAEAKYDNGVLTLTLPKKPGTASKQFKVQ